MANRQTSGKVSRRDGEMIFQHNETDSPIIPVAHLERLHAFKPDAVDWVISQTQIEAEHRRAEDKRVNTFIFVERFVGQIFGLGVGLAGIAAGAYVAINGQPAAGGVIASVSITGLAAAFISGRKR